MSFQVSCSYGPGRYDPDYEIGGNDYPIGFVRWTEQRNFEAVLDLMASGTLETAPLVSHRFELADAAVAYDLLASDEPSLGILLEYSSAVAANTGTPDRNIDLGAKPAMNSAVNVAFLGAGNYAARVLIPAFKANGAHLHSIVSLGGINSIHIGRKFGFSQASTDSLAALTETAVNTVVVATRHNAHAQQVLTALQADKHVFCEKPLCLTLDELDAIEKEARARPGQKLVVGFNRRFAPQVVRAKALLDKIAEPKSFLMTVNAGEIPSDHWTQDREVGGGRIVGEACHFVDLLRHLAGAPIITNHAVKLGAHPGLSTRDDKSSITLTFADGSTGTIHYLANGNKGFPKERLEVFCAGRVLQLDNFRKMRGWGWKDFSRMNLWKQEKGQNAFVKAFIASIQSGAESPIPLNEVFEASRVSIELARDLAQ